MLLSRRDGGASSHRHPWLDQTARPRTVLVLAVELWPALFTRFSDATSLSQVRRAAGFVPFPFALAGGAAVLARLTHVLVLPAGLAAGIVLHHRHGR